MQLELESSLSLPPLSWFARVRKGGAVLVRHGAGIETQPNRFVEGAWDADFEHFEFDTAQYLAGSGCVVRGGRCVFAAPFHPLEWLYVLESGAETLVSNSLVFLFNEASDGPDLTHPNYLFDLLGVARQGIERPGLLRTARGKQVKLYAACRLSVDANLELSRIPQPLGPPPGSYAELYELLAGSVERILVNAADPARKQTYRSVAACSRGYDSTAVAALAKAAGCAEGVTFARSGLPTGHPLVGLDKPLTDDSGADCLRALGMSCTEVDRLDVLSMPGFPKAEFFYSLVATTDASTRAMEKTIQGSVFLTGRHGERYWGPTSRSKRTNFVESDDCNFSGRAATEFRLRAGYINLPAPYIGALHAPALHRITHSDEMRPWMLGSGYYDRPIARRIAEEAGVPREAFGHIKFGGSDQAWALNDESERDFQDFVQSEVPEAIRRRLNPQPIINRVKSHHRAKYLRTNYSHQPFAARLQDLLQTDRLHKMWGSTYLYTFHWGLEKVRARYA